jgi:hypothetical protein
VKLILIPYVDSVYRRISLKKSWFFTMKIIKENMYLAGRTEEADDKPHVRKGDLRLRYDPVTSNKMKHMC